MIFVRYHTHLIIHTMIFVRYHTQSIVNLMLICPQSLSHCRICLWPLLWNVLDALAENRMDQHDGGSQFRHEHRTRI